MTRTVYLASWLVDKDFRPVPDAALVVEGSAIRYAGPAATLQRTADDRTVRLDNTMLCPGFINAHCHLELTCFHETEEVPGSFTQWLEHIKTIRDQTDDADLSDSIRAGLRMSVEGGVTTIADLRNLCHDYSQFADHSMRKVFFREVIGFVADKADEVFDRTLHVLREIGQTPLMTVGVAPHAPYSVSPPLFHKLHRWTLDNGGLFHTHLSEDFDEIRFIEKGDGPFKEFLQRISRYDPSWCGLGVSPVRHLHSLGVLQDAMAVHCNYLAPGDLQCLREAAAHIVYCPRSHQYFKRRNHPLKTYLETGLNLSLGTDSYASNWGLSILDEMRRLREVFPDIPAQTIVRIATLGGAIALKLDHLVGTLQAGKEADITGVGISLDHPDPLEALLTPQARIHCTIVAGKELYMNPRKFV